MDVHMAVLLLACAAAAQDCTLENVTGQALMATRIERYQLSGRFECARKCYDDPTCAYIEITPTD
ncbi:hypothetical protein Y032_0315g2256, partial [Ancylostoma ceylanicum]